MKKLVLKILPILGFVITLTVTAVYANPSGPLKANIPFDFSVGNKTLPAGVYTVRSITVTDTLLIRREDGRVAVTIQTQGVQARRGQDQSKLVFHRYGARYFLAQVWTTGNSDVRELRKSRAERELNRAGSKNLARNEVEPEVVSILAQ